MNSKCTKPVKHTGKYCGNIRNTTHRSRVLGVQSRVTNEKGITCPYADLLVIRKLISLRMATSIYESTLAPT